MSKILVSGLINIETTLKISQFPLEYNLVNYPFFGVASTVSGVGLNVSKALSLLGNDVNLLSLIGNDYQGEMASSELKSLGIGDQYIKRSLKETPQSVILYDESGRRQIHVDLKDLQETLYPEDLFKKALQESTLAVLCNINFSRKLLTPTKEAGLKIATDVHVLHDLHDAYNTDFMRAADILFLSHEAKRGHEEEFVRKLAKLYENEIIVMGMGQEGALLYVKQDQFLGRFPAIPTRKIINTIGAGDALFSSFLHFYHLTADPYSSIKKAILFASWKIGEKGAGQGLLNALEMDKLIKEKLS